MKLGLKIVIAILIIVIIIALVMFIQLEGFRYYRLQNKSALHKLDCDYRNLPYSKYQKHHTVISLTTIPDRIELLYPTLNSLLDQTVRVDEIIINIPYVSRKGKPYIIPEWLSNLESVTVNRPERDYGPSTKLVPLLLKYREDEHRKYTRIIVVDDDNIYHSTTVNRLIKDFEKLNEDFTRPKIALSQFGVILNKNCTVPKFGTWSRSKTTFESSQEVDLLQGCFGFVVTPDMFPNATLDLNNRPDFAVSVDDIWFSCWLTVNGIKIYNSSYTFNRLPLANRGEIYNTVRLVNGENAGLVRDQKTIAWFIENYNYTCVKSRACAK